MSRASFSPSLLRRRWAAPTACLALGVLTASCGSSATPCEDHFSSTVVASRLSVSGSRRVDLLLDIDNSRSMADKQFVLGLAVPYLVQELVNPPCVDPQTGAVVTTPDGPLATCPTGAERQFAPVLDLHVGVVSSSLGGHGSDACTGAGNPSANDKAHLLDRKDPTLPDKIGTYQNIGFLAWDPEQKLTPPGEADTDADSAADQNNTALAPQLRDLVMGAGEIGCGYEAQLEAWYRFLVDPSPADSVTLDKDAKVVLNGIDKVLLDQRKAFLRPDSLVAIVMLTDENDCSIRESGQFYFAAQQKTTNGTPFHMPKARAICDQDPNNECCFSCGQTGPKDKDGNPACAADPTCKTADGKTVYLDETTDNINLRCHDQKRRFGIDFLYGTDRYQKALSSSTVTDRNGAVVPNPLFSDLDQSDNDTNTRVPSMIFLTGLVGVPWQDIARTNTNGAPDLKQGLDASGVKRGGFKTAAEMAQPLPGKDYTAWDVILGKPEGYPAKEALPKDPLMIESIDPRTGTNPVTGDALAPPSQPHENPINGNEYTIPKRDDLQYACVFPLVKVDQATGSITPQVRDCSVPGKYIDCDCDDKTNDNPLCQPAPAGNTDQTKAKAYPGLRELQVLRDVGAQGIVASVCPAQLSEAQDADFGYRPAVDALVNRLASTPQGCLQPSLSAGEDGRVTCVVIEAKAADPGQANACNQCAGSGRDPVSDAHQGAVQDITASNPAGGFNCFCEIPQLEGNAAGEPLWACQNDPSKVPVTKGGDPVNGYCYVDPSKALGNPALVEGCPDDDRRLLRFTGTGAPSSGGTVFLMCVVEHPLGACTNSQ